MPPAPQVPTTPHRTVGRPGAGFARIYGEPTGEAPLLLLHGLGATSTLNWGSSIDALAARTQVVTVDHPGHGHGRRCGRAFRLADCADDAAAVVREHLGRPVVAVGFSMGGPIAQLLAHRHPELVDGLVLCATARDFRGAPVDRIRFGALAVAWQTLGRAPVPGLGRIAATTDPGSLRDELRLHEPAAVLAASAALGRFSSREWVGDLDVPSAVVVHERDRLVPPRRQHRLAAALCDAETFTVDGTHMAPWDEPEAFVPVLVDAVASVERRRALDARLDPARRPARVARPEASPGVRRSA